MNTFHRLVVVGTLTTLVSISGCIVSPGAYNHGPYRYENGDRIDRDGNREAHWCDSHNDDEGCHH
jgi:hypothetical protein